MKRAVAFLFVALFILLVVEPNFVGNQAARKDKIPVYVDGSALKTNNDVETKQATSQATIYIDPTRGGSDVGYSAENQISEKDLLMQLALSIGSSLEKAGYKVEYSRWYDDVPACSTEDECESIRLTKAKEVNADYILSLSLNQDTSLHRGFSIFTQPNNLELEDLAKEMANQIRATSYTRDEGIDTDHYDSFAILKDTETPALLLQIGYITNPNDYDKISNTKFQARIANAITQAFLTCVN